MKKYNQIFLFTFELGKKIIFAFLLIVMLMIIGCETKIAKNSVHTIAPLVSNDVIKVKKPVALPVEIPTERIPLGIEGDYKPCLALLPSGELILCFFHSESQPHDKIRENIFFYRSFDGGKTWQERESVNLIGREPYFTVTRNGTLFITTHLLSNDVRNEEKVTHAYIHRSEDGGHTWETVKITAADFHGASAKETSCTSRTLLELTDGTIIVGLSASHGYDYLWRSTDKGKTWGKNIASEFEGVNTKQYRSPFWGETRFWEALNGNIIGILRCDGKKFPIPGDLPPETDIDHFDRMIIFRSKDGGTNWTREPELGSYYSEMYPNIIRFQDKRLLLTFTVRAGMKEHWGKAPTEEHPFDFTIIADPDTQLGLNAVFGIETEDGFTFDFKHDRLILEEKTTLGISSGGGFGNTIQLADGTLITAYSYNAGKENEDFVTHIEVMRWLLP